MIKVSEETRIKNRDRERRRRQQRSEEERAAELQRLRDLRANRSEVERAAELQRLRNVSSSRSEIERAAELERLQNLRFNRSAEERTKEIQRRRNCRREVNLHNLELVRKIALRNLDEFVEDIPLNYLGNLSEICQFCGAKHFKKERPSDKKFNVCCNKGSVVLPPISTNEYIMNLMTGEDPDSKIFMQNIRSYNSALAFVSVGANINVPRGFGPYCFKIHGQMYHLSSTLHPPQDNSPKYAQLYILDESSANDERMNNPANQACQRHIMNKLSEIIGSNPLAQAYKMMHEVEEEQKQQYGDTSKIHMRILQNRNSDPRRYNPQRCNEVAVIFVSPDGEPPIDRDLLVYLRPSENVRETSRVDYRDRNLDALTYPLLFPNGEQSWGIGLALHNVRGTSSRQISLKQYYSYYLQIRDSFNPFLRAGRLTQQYVVDAYVKAESNDLNFIRTKQTELRLEKRTDLINVANDADARSAGKQIILPSTFTGSPRNMQQCYQDAIAITTKYGKPDLFITMTCNPKWKEIVENLADGEKCENRPDLVVRVFRLKLKELMEDIIKNEMFGKINSYVQVIEFQKRGLPHAHIIFTLAANDKPKDVETIDRIVSAEIPDKNLYPELHKIITTNMIHRPCDARNRSAQCLINGKCSKGYPKKFQNETTIHVDGYPTYRRRQFDPIAVGKFSVDNSWVVPYNPYLSLRYNCHINVEICASFKSVKYLFKYAFKGTDCANVNFQIDEVQTFVDSRYVSPPEGMWRLYRFEMHLLSHSIMRLVIHLDGEQAVVYEPNLESVSRALRQNKDTTLTAWFKTNQENDAARIYKYCEFPEHFVFIQKDRKWQPRKAGFGKTFGRMYYVNIKDTERYYLRLLLLHIPGATSFEYLKTVNGVQYPTYFEAARAMGLTTDENVWSHTLTDAASVAMPRYLRELFAYVCIFSVLTDMSGLWNIHKDSLIEDFRRKHGHLDNQECHLCVSYSLREIQNVLMVHGKKCIDFSLPPISENLPLQFDDGIDVQVERELAEQLIPTLNAEQQKVFDVVRNSMSCNGQESRCFFLDGPGGTGKTHFYKTLSSYIRGNGQDVVVVATTGIAANLLKCGRTYHSMFKIPLKLNETSVSGINLTSEDAKTINEAKLIIWDEATMTPGLALDCVDRLLKEITHRQDLFLGGKILLMGGDFRQCLPVIPGADSSEVVQTSLKFHRNWHEFKQLKLQTNMRSRDPNYSDWLIKLGNGELTNDVGLNENYIEIPSFMLSENIIADIFGTTLKSEDIESYFNVTILSLKNQDVNDINLEVLSILEGEERCYLSCDSLLSEDNDDIRDYPVENLNSLQPSGTAPHNLKIKIGAIVILLRNLNTKRGLCNGTRLIAVELKPNLIVAKVLTGSAKGEVVFIPRMELITDAGLPFQLRRLQFPINLAFAMTINKSQGQTFDKVGIYLPDPVFSHGQLYVAFSRVRRSTDVKVLIKNTTVQGTLVDNSSAVFTKNIVYKSVL